MIQNIVFDMGQVIIRFNPDLFINRYAHLTDNEKKILKNTVFRSVEWVMMDHGLLNNEEAYRIIQQRLPESLRSIAAELIFHWHDPVMVIPGMEALICSLHRNGYRLFLLSNAGFDQPDYWKTVSVHPLFEGVMLSCNVKRIKPDPEIYRIFTDRYSLDPEECIFIDDNPANVEAAIGCGWQGIVFNDDADECCEKLKALGISCELQDKQ